MLRINLNTPLKIDTGEEVSTVIVMLDNYEISEKVDFLEATLRLKMYRTIEDAIDRFRDVWLIDIPHALRNIRTTLTASQYNNVDINLVHDLLLEILEGGDSASQWQEQWPAWEGLTSFDAANMIVKEMPTVPSAAPAGMNVSLNGLNVDIIWTDVVKNEFGYIIERSLTKSTGFIIIARVKYGVGKFTDPGLRLKPGVKYFYRVAGWNNAGVGIYSAEDSITTV